MVILVLSYWGWESSKVFCPRQIGTELSCDVLNPTHVPLWMANSHTLGTSFSSRMRWVDIEVPNNPVDKGSWGLLACYPRRTFYPLSNGPTTRYHRITMADFRPCSTCSSCSQANICHCALRTISKRSEFTFARLRYSLGGDRPSQTTHHAMSSDEVGNIGVRCWARGWWRFIVG